MEKDSLSEKFDKYKIALILAVVIMDILLAAIYFSGNDEKETQPPAEVQQTAEQVTVTLQAPPKPKIENKVDANGGYGVGQYKIGVDIPAGEYLRIRGNVKFYPADTIKLEVPLDNMPEGHYKVGKDIPAGEYKFHINPSGYFSVLRDSYTNTIIAHGGSMQMENLYVTVYDGQYLRISNATAELVK